MVNKIYEVMEKIFFLIQLNVYWLAFTILGGVVLGIVPSTIALFTCIRDRIRNQDESKLFPQYKKAFMDNFKRSLVFTLVFALGLGLILLETSMLSSVKGQLGLEIAIKVTRLILIILGIMFFPTFVHFDVHGWHTFFQPLMLIFMCPIEVILIFVVMVIVAFMFYLSPFLVVFLGISLPAYGVMAIMLHKFTKMQEKIPYIQEAE